MSEPGVDRRLLRELESMGFPTNRATRALYCTGNCSLEAALDWAMEHQNDSDIDQITQVPINIEIEDGNQFSLPEEVKLEAKKILENAIYSAKKLEDLKTMETEVDKVAKAIRETTINDPNSTEDERSRILSKMRAKVEEQKKLREKKLEEDQKERMKTNKMLLESKRQLEESQRKRSLAQTDLEKGEERRAREKIRRRIEEDKAERRTKLGLPNEIPAVAQPIVSPIIEKKKDKTETLLMRGEQFKDCLRSLKRNHKDENAKVKRAFQTLLRIVGNIAKSPNEDKYRRIRLSNPSFQEKVGSLKGGIEFLELIGFEKTKEGEELYLLMPREKIDVQLLNLAGNELLSAMSNPYFGLLSQ